MAFISQALMDFFRWINDTITGNFGWTIVIFTILFRALCLPIDIRSRVGMRTYAARMRIVQPKMDAMQKAYKHDPQLASRKIMELRKEEGIGLLPPGCLPQLLLYPFFFIFFSVFRDMAAVQTLQLANAINSAAAAGGDIQGVVNGFLSQNGWLWVHNIWMPDNAFNTSQAFFIRIIPFINSATADVLPTGNYLMGMFPKQAIKVTDIIQPAWTHVTNMLPARNGLFILPLLAAVVQYFSFSITQKMNPPPAMDPNNPQAASGTKMNKIMGIAMPLMFALFCLSSSSALAIYWITSSLLMLITNVVINEVMNRRDARKAQQLTKG